MQNINLTSLSYSTISRHTNVDCSAFWFLGNKIQEPTLQSNLLPRGLLKSSSLGTSQKLLFILTQFGRTLTIHSWGIHMGWTLSLHLGRIGSLPIFSTMLVQQNWLMRSPCKRETSGSNPDMSTSTKWIYRIMVLHYLAKGTRLNSSWFESKYILHGELTATACRLALKAMGTQEQVWGSTPHFSSIYAGTLGESLGS